MHQTSVEYSNINLNWTFTKMWNSPGNTNKWSVTTASKWWFFCKFVFYTSTAKFTGTISIHKAPVKKRFWFEGWMAGRKSSHLPYFAQPTLLVIQLCDLSCQVTQMQKSEKNNLPLFPGESGLIPLLPKVANMTMGCYSKGLTHINQKDNMNTHWRCLFEFLFSCWKCHQVH